MAARNKWLYSVTHPYNHGRKEYIINLGGYNDSGHGAHCDGDIPQYRDLPRIQHPGCVPANDAHWDQTAARGRETVLQDIPLEMI